MSDIEITGVQNPFQGKKVIIEVLKAMGVSPVGDHISMYTYPGEQRAGCNVLGGRVTFNALQEDLYIDINVYGPLEPLIYAWVFNSLYASWGVGRAKALCGHAGWPGERNGWMDIVHFGPYRSERPLTYTGLATILSMR